MSAGLPCGNPNGVHDTISNVVVVINTPTSYLEISGIKFRPRRPPILTEVYRGFVQSLQANSGTS
jgi:hypothetical protein